MPARWRRTRAERRTAGGPLLRPPLPASSAAKRFGKSRRRPARVRKARVPAARTHAVARAGRQSQQQLCLADLHQHHGRSRAPRLMPPRTRTTPWDALTAAARGDAQSLPRADRRQHGEQAHEHLVKCRRRPATRRSLAAAAATCGNAATLLTTMARSYRFGSYRS